MYSLIYDNEATDSTVNVFSNGVSVSMKKREKAKLNLSPNGNGGLTLKTLFDCLVI